MALPDAVRRKGRHDKKSTFKALAARLRKCIDTVETAPLHVAAEMRRLLAPTIGRNLSSAAFGDLVDQPVSPWLSVHDLESRAATSHAGPNGLLEEYAEINRRAVASRHGDRLFAGFNGCVAESLEAALAVEQLNTGGHPAVRARRIALVRLMQLYVELSGRPLPAQPSKAFLDFAESCFVAIGLPTLGLGPAAGRLFDLLRKGRPGRPRRRRRGPLPPDASGAAKAPA